MGLLLNTDKGTILFGSQYFDLLKHACYLQLKLWDTSIHFELFPCKVGSYALLTWLSLQNTTRIQLVDGFSTAEEERRWWWWKERGRERERKNIRQLLTTCRKEKSGPGIIWYGKLTMVKAQFWTMQCNLNHGSYSFYGGMLETMLVRDNISYKGLNFALVLQQRSN